MLLLYYDKVVALYYATIENLPFDFTIKLCYTIIREGGEEPSPIYINGRASWKLDRRSWNFIEAGSWELELLARQADKLENVKCLTSWKFFIYKKNIPILLYHKLFILSNK